MSERADMFLAGAIFMAAHRANYSYYWTLIYGYLCMLAMANATLLGLRKLTW